MGNFETSWIWKLKDLVSGPLEKVAASSSKTEQGIMKIQAGVSALEGTFSGLTGKLFQFNQAAEAIQRVSAGFNAAVAPGVQFESALADVEAITGITGEALDKLGGNARAAALQFGGSAASQLDQYKVLLSRLGPEIAADADALGAMGQSVSVLSKTMGGDTAGAVGALTTGLLQFNVSLENPRAAAAEMVTQMNIMAAAAQQGAAEVPSITTALEQAGVSAYNAKLSFAETNAAIQALAKGGKYGSEAGVALRNVLSKLEKGRFLPKDTQSALIAAGVNMSTLSDKTLPFTERLGELKKIMNDSALITHFFGDENSAAANILLRNTDYMADLTTKIEGTNTALDQANVIMKTGAERFARQRAAIDDLGISFYKLSPSLALFGNGLLIATSGLAQIAPALPLIAQSASWLSANFMMAATASWTFGRSVLVGAWSLARMGAASIFAGIQGLGTFIIRLVTGRINVLSFAASLFTTAIPAVYRFTAGIALAGVSALRTAGSWIFAAVTALPSLITSLSLASIAQWALNIAMYANPLGAIIAGLVAVGAAVYAVVEYWDEIKAAIAQFVMWVLKNNPFAWMIDLIDVVFPGFKDKVKEVFMAVVNWFKRMWDSIKGVWNSITSFFGFGGDDADVSISVSDESGNSSSGYAAAPDPAGGNTDTSLTDDISGGLSSVSGGDEGGKVRNVSISIGKITGIENLNTTNIKQGITNMKDEIKRAVIDAVRDAEIVLASE